MMSVTIEVNGVTVAMIHAHRGTMTGILNDSPCYEYPWRGIEFPIGRMDRETCPDVPAGKTGTVVHRYSDGIVKLSELLCGAFTAKQPTPRLRVDVVYMEDDTTVVTTGGYQGDEQATLDAIYINGLIEADQRRSSTKVES